MNSNSFYEIFAYIVSHIYRQLIIFYLFLFKRTDYQQVQVLKMFECNRNNFTFSGKQEVAEVKHPTDMPPEYMANRFFLNFKLSERARV